MQLLCEMQETFQVIIDTITLYIESTLFVAIFHPLELKTS